MAAQGRQVPRSWVPAVLDKQEQSQARKAPRGHQGPRKPAGPWSSQRAGARGPPAPRPLPARTRGPHQPSPRSPSCRAAPLTSPGARVPEAAPRAARAWVERSAARAAGISGARRACSLPAAVWDLRAGRRARQPPRASGQDVPPARPPCAPVRRCATSLLGPLVMVYMVRSCWIPHPPPASLCGPWGAGPLRTEDKRGGAERPTHAPCP